MLPILYTMLHTLFLVAISAICIFAESIPSSQEILKLEPSYRRILRNVNDSVSVKCYMGDTDHMALTWTGPNGELIPVTNSRNVRIRVESTPSSAHYANLILENLDENDGGSYVCKSDSSAINSTSFALEIFDQIIFDSAEKMQFAVVGQNYTVKCTVNKRQNKRLVIHWKVNNRTMDYSRMTRLNDGLLINKVYKNDSGEYLCTAMDLESDRPQIKRQMIKLITLKEPVTESKLYGSPGQNVKLPCRSPSDFESIKWLDNFNQEITPSHENQMCFIFNSLRQASTLQVRINDENSFGNYTCITTDSLNRTFGHKFQLSPIGTHNHVNTTPLDNIKESCSPPSPTSTENTTLSSTDAYELDESSNRPPKDFLCEETSFMIISYSLTCDGYSDCPNGSDESESLCKGTISTPKPTGSYEMADVLSHEEVKPGDDTSKTLTETSTLKSVTVISKVINKDGSTTVKTNVITNSTITVTTWPSN